MHDNNSFTSKSPVNLGTILLLIGLFIIALLFMERSEALPFELPKTWYLHRYLWVGLGMISFFYGCMLLRGNKVSSQEWEPTHGGNRFDSLVLYTREDCHLCSQAKDILWEYNDFLPDIDEVDIDTDVLLQEKFNSCVPVVEIDGKIRFRGQINEVLLRRLIEHGS